MSVVVGYRCQACGKMRSASTHPPVFDFVKKLVHCGCAK